MVRVNNCWDSFRFSVISALLAFCILVDSVFTAIKSTGKGSIGEMVHNCKPKGAGSDYQAGVSLGFVPWAKAV
jgi:hypothetical protein